MLLMIIGLVLIFMRPSWGFLFFFAGCIAALSAVFAVLAASSAIEGHSIPVVLAARAISIVISVGIFIAIGAVIVVARGGKREDKSPKDKEIDAELARVRAEIAAREGQPPS